MTNPKPSRLIIHDLLSAPGVVKKDRKNRKVIHLSSEVKETKMLVHYLRNHGCFTFYCTNSGKRIIGLSQVIYFLYSGYKAFRNGFTASKNHQEIHHIDGDITNNCFDNLVLLSNSDHRVVTELQKATLLKFSKGNHFNLNDLYLSECLDDDKTLFNNQGRIIKNHQHFLSNVISKTILKSVSSEWFKKAAKQNIPIIAIENFVQKFNPSKYDYCYYREQLLKGTYLMRC